MIQNLNGLINIEKKDFYLFGAGDTCRNFINLVGHSINICAIIDNDKEKQDHSVLGYKIIELDEFERSETRKIIITSALYFNNIKRQLEKRGFVYNVDFFYYRDLISIIMWKIKKQLWQNSIEIDITSKCSLRCKNCAVFLPYITHHKDIEIDELINNIDNYFRVVDYVYTFFISGGEALLHKNIDEIIEYVGKKYRDKISKLVIISNGTIMPKEKTLKLLQHYQVTLSITGYKDDIVSKEKHESLLQLLNQNKVSYEIVAMDNWVDFGNPLIKKCEEDRLLKRLFEECDTPCRVLFDNKVFFCSINCAAVRGNIFEGHNGDYFDLLKNENDKETQKINMIKFDLGQTPNGYVSFCSNCNGHVNVNKNYIEVAEQLKGANYNETN